MITYFDLVLSFSVLHLLSLHIAASFVKGTIDCKSLSTCLPAIFHLRQKNRVILSGAAWRKEKKLWMVCIFQVSTQQHVKRQRKHLFKVIARQVLLERRSHAAERGMKRFLSHPLHYTSVKRKQGAYQIVLRFHLF